MTYIPYNRSYTMFSSNSPKLQCHNPSLAFNGTPKSKLLNKKQGGFLFGADFATVLVGASALAFILFPVYKTYSESTDASAISVGYTTIQKAVQERYPDADYSSASIANIKDTLPEDFKVMAVNGQNYSVTVSPSNKSEMVITLPIPQTRLRTKVVAKLGSSSVTVSGNNVVMTTR